MVPATLVVKAQIFRRWYRERVLELFKTCDAILAPATPCTAPKIGQQTFMLDGVELPVRPNMGIYTQPISFIGLPVVAVPVPLSSRCRSRCRSSPRPGARISPCASRMRWNRWARSRRPDRTFRGDDIWRSTCRRSWPRCASAFGALRKSAGGERRAGAQRLLPRRCAHHPLRRRRNPLRLRRDQGVPRRALAGRARPHALAHGDHHLRPRLRRRLDALRAPLGARQDRPADADLGEIPGRLARGRRACQPDRQA